MTRSVCSALEGSDLDALVRLVDVLKGEKWSQSGSYLDPLFTNQVLFITQFASQMIRPSVQKAASGPFKSTMITSDNKISAWRTVLMQEEKGYLELNNVLFTNKRHLKKELSRHIEQGRILNY